MRGKLMCEHVVVCVSVFGLPLLALGDESVRRQFLEAYEPRATDVQRHYTNVMVKYRTRSDPPWAKTVEVAEGEAKFNLLNYLIATEARILNKQTGQEISRSKRRTEGRNRQYSFVIGSAAEGPPVLQDLTVYDADSEPPLCFLSVPYADYMRKQTFVQMARDNATQIVAFQDSNWQGKPAKELRVKYTFANPWTKKTEDVTRGYFFSPQQGWVCCGSRGYPGGDSPEWVEEIYSYEGEGRFPPLKRLEHWFKDAKEPKNASLFRVTDVTEFRRSAPFPESDFRVSAFGLPEPPGIDWSRPTPIWLWIVTAAVALFVIAGVFVWLKRRASAAAT